MDDQDLLRDYVRRRSQEAFQQLVTRHLPMVLSAARRLLRDAHLAEEVAQNVFTLLAQKADAIRPPQIIGGWLYNTTRHLASHAVRTEQRRREREQTAVAMQTLEPAPDDPRFLEHLEPAMAGLDAEDRDALVLRYLENRSLRAVGAELGISEDAARMRVNRALERLRTGFEKQGIRTTTVVLATAITAGTATVPAGLGAAITSIALGGAATATAAATKVIALSALQKALITAGLIAAAAGLYQARQASVLRTQVQVLQAKQTLADEQAGQLTRERDDATRQLAALREDNDTRMNRTAGELLKLRAEAARLRGEAPAESKGVAAGETNKARIVVGILITNTGPRWPHWISQEHLRTLIHSKVGEPFDPLKVNDDIRIIYATGLFSNTRVSEENVPDGVLLTYVLQEKSSLEPGKYISKAQLAFVGYNSPEAALQSLTWAMVCGNFEMMINSLLPEMAPDDAARSQFEATARKEGQLFKGMQILARKDVSDDKAEIKVIMDAGPLFPNNPDRHEVQIQTMVKAGADWKLGGDTRGYSLNWEQNGTIQTFTR